MLIFQQIVVNSEKDIFNEKENKIIKFSYNAVATTSQNHSIYVNSKIIKWAHNMSFPFQIVDKSDSNQNPEQLKLKIKGSIQFQKGSTFQQAGIHNQNGIKIGTIEVKFRTTSIILQKAGQIMPKNQKMVIKSMIAYLPQVSHKKTYISIKLGDIHKQTPVIKSNGGEIVFTQGWQLQKSSYTQEAIFQIFAIFDKGNEVKMIANGRLDLNDDYLQRKISLNNSRNQQIGNLYIKGRLISKRMAIDQKINTVKQSRFKQKSKTIDASKLSRYQQISNNDEQKNSKQVSPILIRNNINNSVDLSKLSSSESSRLLLSSSNVSNSLSRIKKIRIFNNNNDIVFPQQPRFKIYQDKQSDFISYLTKRDDLTLRQIHSGKFYKGASIGYGDKTDFAHKGSPGVGRYKLPSIWDRY